MRRLQGRPAGGARLPVRSVSAESSPVAVVPGAGGQGEDEQGERRQAPSRTLMGCGMPRLAGRHDMEPNTALDPGY
ncbi:hypothetical protein OHA53_27125 [Streptomyces althioticus]|uniref:hypothetical protein n=1 Tax=Streptomyces althioticus TaxID=83380 RepID=UPI00177FEC9D|nr:hypothetical protein OHA53_27125 [Streptomyces althioticus]